MTALPSKGRSTLLAGLLFLCACGSGKDEARAPRLVLLYATCTLNKEHLAPYEESVQYTPNLAAFAAAGVVFERHATESGQSGIDFAALFTGGQAYLHGTYFHPKELADEVTTIAEAFAADGWRTHFWSGQPMASARLNYGQGVEPKDIRDQAAGFRPDAKGLSRQQIARLTATDASFDSVLDELVANPEARAFVQLDFTLTHNPYHHYVSRERILAFLERFPEHANGVTKAELDRYLPLYEEERLGLQNNHFETVERLGLSPGEVDGMARTVEVAYRACVHQLDEYFGFLLAKVKERGLEDEALIAFTADHGELLFRENALFKWSHGMQLAPEVLDIPWLLRGPGVRPGTYPDVTRSIDVFPTLASLAGVPLPEDARIEGVDLTPGLRKRGSAPKLMAFSHTTIFPEQRLERARMQRLTLSLTYHGEFDPERMWVRVRRGDVVCKLRNLDGTRWGVEVFDLSTDPGEATNLFDPEDEDHAELVAAAEAYKARLVKGFREGPLETGLTEEESLERLRALGYVR